MIEDAKDILICDIFKGIEHSEGSLAVYKAFIHFIIG